MKRVVKLAKSVRVIGLVVLACVFSNAYSANILVVTTDETDPLAVEINNNIYDLFSDPLLGNTVTDARNTLGSASTAAMPSFAGYDYVVVVANYYGLEADEEAALLEAIDEQASAGFALFFAGQHGGGALQGTSYNANMTAEVFNASVVPTPSPDIEVSPSLPSFYFYDTAFGDYVPVFTSNNVFVLNGGNGVGMLNIPVSNRIFRVLDSPNPLISFFYPGTETNGSCLFAITDTEAFSTANLAGVTGFANAVQTLMEDTNNACVRIDLPDVEIKVQAIPSLNGLGVFILSLSVLGWVLLKALMKKRFYFSNKH